MPTPIPTPSPIVAPLERPLPPVPVELSVRELVLVPLLFEDLVPVPDVVVVGLGGRECKSYQEVLLQSSAESNIRIQMLDFAAS